MKYSKFLNLSVLGIFVSSSIIAQTKGGAPLPSYNSLKINSAPAFTLLGVNPDNIQHPSTPKAIVGSLQNAFSGSQAQPGFAMEVTPYYLSHNIDSPHFWAADYLLPDKSVWAKMAKNFSVSAATSSSDTAFFGKLGPGTTFGIGIRTIIVETRTPSKKLSYLMQWNTTEVAAEFYTVLIDIMRSQPSLRSLPDSIRAAQKEWKKTSLRGPYFKAVSYSYSTYVVDSITNDVLKKLSVLRNDSEIDPLALKLRQDYVNPATKEQESLLHKIAEDPSPFVKSGFMLELDAADALLFQGSQFNNCYQAKAAIWLIPSFRWQLGPENSNKVSLLDLMAIIKYTFNNKTAKVDTSNYFDLGLKMQYSRQKWTCGLEGVYRNAQVVPADIQKHDTYSWTVSFNYIVTDNITFTANFGANFNGNTATYTSPNQIFTVGGFNIGF